uniref:Reverse transcriptase domain-containing protein n=1 Tax=Trichobilharzia regenti TaxID=157069 RepID=A0AA85JIT5_TRIRE|nr:unnamed protein product [Trichobilharzia regenti]
MYGVPKIHKEQVPLRPILSMINSPQHKVARWLAEKLEPIRQRLGVHTVKDSFHFSESVNHMNVLNNFMVSFDVTSLFTMIPVNETIEIICQQSDLLPLPESEFKRLLLMCTMDVQFLFDNTFYRQIDGVAMGSPLSPVLADIFMSNLERTKLKHAIDETSSYCRYVDDTFIVCKNKSHASHLLRLFNGAHANIDFTMEHESDGKFHFLDIAMERLEDGSLQKSIYRKPTWKGQYLHFNSFCPHSFKRGLVKTLYYRARRICSTEKLEEEFEFLENILKRNGYPQRFINKYGRSEVKRVKQITVEKKPVYLQLDYKGENIAAMINRRLSTSLAIAYPAAKLVPVYRTTYSLVQSKIDRYPSHVTSNCVYKFTCICGSSYIGRTERRAYLRFSEHVPKSLRLKGTNALNSAITRHLLDTGHEVDVEKSFKIINKQNSSILLKFAEAISIKRLKPDLCVQKEAVISLSLPW